MVGAIFDHNATNDFNVVVEDLVELTTICGNFTWKNGTRINHPSSGLDCMLDNKAWIERWPRAKPMLLQGITSNHCHST